MYDARKLTKDEWRERREAREAEQRANTHPDRQSRSQLEAEARAWARGDE